MNWLLRRARALRTWIFVRLGLLRGRWRRVNVAVKPTRFFPGALAIGRWRYGLYVPAGLADDESAPLIVLLHGCGQRALNFAHASGWTQLADRARVRLLCPDQRRLANLYRCWNWFHPLDQSGQGELSVVTSMIDDAMRRVSVEAGHVAAAGLSAGGALAALLAFHFPQRFRAVVTVAAPPLLGSFNMQAPQDVMRRGLSLSPSLALGTRRIACAPLAVIHGLADNVVTPRCAGQLREQAIESLRRAGLQIEQANDGAQLPQATVTDYRNDAALVLRGIDVTGLKHAWAGGPGGHPHCERGGPPLTAWCEQFLRDVGMLRAQ